MVIRQSLLQFGLLHQFLLMVRESPLMVRQSMLDHNCWCHRKVVVISDSMWYTKLVQANKILEQSIYGFVTPFNVTDHLNGLSRRSSQTPLAAALLGTRPNISESHIDMSTRVPFCIALQDKRGVTRSSASS